MGGDDRGRRGDGGGGITVPRCTCRPFVQPRLRRGSGRHGGGWPSQRRATGAAVPDSRAQARGAGSQRQQRQAQGSPSAVAPQVRRRPPPLCRPDGPKVTMVMTVPARRPAATPAMATPLGMAMPLLLPLPAKRMTRDRRTTSTAAAMGTMTRRMTSGGGVCSSTRPPPRRHRLSATSSAMPLLRPACCCWASQCPELMSNTATP
jgi:hypothetical protein